MTATPGFGRITLSLAAINFLNHQGNRALVATIGPRLAIVSAVGFAICMAALYVTFLLQILFALWIVAAPKGRSHDQQARRQGS